jgi:hypothetical protein
MFNIAMLLQAGNMDENQQQLNRAFSIARWFKLPGFAIGLWLVFYPEPFDVALWITIVFPLVVIGVMRFSECFTAMETPNSGSPYKPMLANLIVPAIALWVRGSQYDIYDVKLQWLVIAAIVLLLFTIVVYSNKYFMQQTTSVLIGRLALVLVPLLLYANGWTAMLNCYYDSSEPQIYKAVVLEKYVELFKKRERYRLKISSWGKESKPADIEVKELLYKAKEVNDSVEVRYGQGLLHIGWYRVRQF